ncbi:hypothetical protein FPZ24_05680 [Sphingomonas panacisoli]|uniref:Uncharacterized protein n=1 Tax=Sphingomonas panacisoli TaxID=1813879 RepID=A0A5B8LIP1_9SPHN|nr:hypothetical protein [Sphingomonas panacisoli]QDZ07030.1 hypothetical protein FPZ24_05680 [Sphingomonas panacisoli]
MFASPFPTPRTGFASARQAARRAWLTVIAVALACGSAAVRIVPGFFSIDMPPRLSDGAPNIWALVEALPWTGGLPLAGLAMAAALGAAAWLIAHFSARPPRGGKLLPATLLVSLTLPALLPQMTAGDFLIAVVLSGMLAVRQRQTGIAALVIAGWVLAFCGFAALGAAPIMVATLLIARPFLASPANDNGLPLNPGEAYPA